MEQMKKKENKRPNDGIKGNLQIKKDGKVINNT